LHQATLFGAAPAAVTGRLDAVLPVFNGTLTAADAKRRLAAGGVDVVIITRQDAVWQARAGWVFASPALLARDNLRIVAVGDLTDGAASAK
jgi:hypothetical protein